MALLIVLGEIQISFNKRFLYFRIKKKICRPKIDRVTFISLTIYLTILLDMIFVLFSIINIKILK